MLAFFFDLWLILVVIQPVGPSVVEILRVRPRVFGLVQPGDLGALVDLQSVVHQLDNIGELKGHVVLLTRVLLDVEQADRGLNVAVCGILRPWRALDCPL